MPPMIQIPYETPPGTSNAVVMLGNNASPPLRIAVQQAAPGIFTTGQNQAALNQDGGINSTNHPAAPGSVLQVFCTGLGPTDRAIDTGVAAPPNPLIHATLNVTANVANQSAQVIFAGLAPGLAGVFQVNIRVPALPAGAHPLIIQAGGVPSCGCGDCEPMTATRLEAWSYRNTPVCPSE